MCGLTGFWSSEGVNSADAKRLAERMAAAIAHRGPDDAGVWVHGEVGIAISHRRLAVLDLSPAGHQPMLSATGRFVIAFNGEIYNHTDLRAQLALEPVAPSWNGHSDTETLLKGFEVWGVVGTLQRAFGMFSFALWDREDRTLTFGRDRIGEKPLYYGLQNGVLLFGSELKAFKPHPAFRKEVDRPALALLMRHGYIPAPYSIFKGIRKLPPGTTLTLRYPSDPQIPAPYWTLATAQDGAFRDEADNADRVVDTLERLLSEAVGRQMLADVPVGAFLSGGIDSSLIVSLMQAQANQPVRTFSIGFQAKSHNEAPYAAAVARHLGTNHTELYVTSRQALDLVPSIAGLYSEPFADSSQIPTHLVCKLARQSVTVALSGDGGDELFCGYNRYPTVRKWRNRVDFVPRILRARLARLAEHCERFDSSQPESWGRLADLLIADSDGEFYRNLISHWRKPDQLVIGGSEPTTEFLDGKTGNEHVDIVTRAMTLDILTYLPDDILCKVDRAAMAVSLETRVPFLDHKVVEFARRLPLGLKLRGGKGKWIVRQALKRHVPEGLFDRPKMGFGVPIEEWLRGDLKDWGASLLTKSRLQQQGYLEAAPVLKKWNEHQKSVNNWDAQLWAVLMFEAWVDAF